MHKRRVSSFRTASTPPMKAAHGVNAEAAHEFNAYGSCLASTKQQRSAAQPSTCFRRHRPLAGSCKCCDVVRRVVGSRCMLLQRAASVSRGAHASVEFDHRQHPPALVRAQVPKHDLSCTRIQTAHRPAPGLCRVCFRTGPHYAPGLRPHLHRDCAHICTGTAPTSAPGLRPHLHRDCTAPPTGRAAEPRFSRTRISKGWPFANGARTTALLSARGRACLTKRDQRAALPSSSVCLCHQRVSLVPIEDRKS